MRPKYDNFGVFMIVPVQKFETIIIGGGPAGLFTASNLVDKGVLLIEKGEKPGRKLLISGTGQCNFTHSGSVSDFLMHYGDNHRFLKLALHEFSNQDLINFFKNEGIESVEDKNGKIFPASLKSYDILKVLINECHNKDINIINNNPVTGVEHADGLFRITTDAAIFICRHLVIATGGLSYPATGSTGDGYRFAKELGHTVIKPQPALCPVIIQNYDMDGLSGISLTNVLISLYHEGKKTQEHRGDMVFTLRGLSGPGILDFSRFIADGDLLRINFIDENPGILSEKFLSDAGISGNSTLQSWIREYDIPKNLLRFLIEKAGTFPGQKLAEISKKIRIKFIELLCEYPFRVERLSGFKIAMATAGGVCLNEISPKTMESKLVKNLYFAGEVLDIDGDTGGYNIQAAFSTAFVASKSINEKFR